MQTWPIPYAQSMGAHAAARFGPFLPQRGPAALVQQDPLNLGRLQALASGRFCAARVFLGTLLWVWLRFVYDQLDAYNARCTCPRRHALHFLQEVMKLVRARAPA